MNDTPFLLWACAAVLFTGAVIFVVWRWKAKDDEGNE